MIFEALRRFFREQDVRPGRRLAVAVSGGIDSTALLLALRELGDYELVAAHVHHHLRGDESDEDERFVRTLGGTVRVADGTLDPASIRRNGIEAAAREVRHARLQEIRAAAGADFIVTAHQQNDQAETVLMRLQSGSGVAGLRGIHPRRADGILRPLLDVPRSALQSFLDQRGVVARSDSSNAELRFARNRVRRVVAAMTADEVAAIADVARLARVLWPEVERLLDLLPVDSEADQAAFALPSDPWLARALLHRHIQRLDPESRDVSAADLERLRQARTRTSVTRSLELLPEGDRLVLHRRVASEPFESELTPGMPARVAGQTVHLLRCEGRPACPLPTWDENHDRLSALIQLPPGAEPRFVVRGRREGDRFQPLGFPFQKKLKDLLIDRKIAARLRDRIPLLLWDGEIVWVGGVEVSERFKVRPGPGDVYEVWIGDDHESFRN